MGWLWASSKPPPSSTILLSPQDSCQPDPFATPQSTLTNPPPPQTPETSAPLSRDEAADAELRAFLESLQDGSTSSSSKTIAPATQSSSVDQSNQSSDLITPHNIHPTTLSCRTAFDTAFYCASLGGQFTSLYRYGQLRRCSQEWADFWWCMQTNRGFMSEEEREARIVARGVQREREKYKGEGKLSSEDVWEQRRRMVPRTAMQGDLERVLEEGRAKGERF